MFTVCTPNLSITHFTGVLLKAFESILTDEAFDLPTAPATEARKSVERVLAWCAKNETKTKVFAEELLATLESCFTNDKKIKVRKEKMWEKFYTLRSSKEYAESWASFLRCSAVQPSQTVYQHVTDIVFNHLIKEHFTTQPQATKDTPIPSLDYNEKNALRYVCGYITRKIYQKLKDSSHKFKDELCLCLAEMNDVDPDEMNDESNEWTKTVDRGGLKHVTNMTYSMFASIETELRRYLREHNNELNEVNILGVKTKVMENDDVLFYWSMVSASWDEEVASEMLTLLIAEYVKIRGHSTASAWLEQYKRDSKKSVQKSKGVRKQLLSKSSTQHSKESSSLNTADMVED